MVSMFILENVVFLTVHKDIIHLDQLPKDNSREVFLITWLKFAFALIYSRAYAVQEVDFKTAAEKKIAYKYSETDNYFPIKSDNEILKEAKSRIGQKGYSLLFYNCEHFVNICRHGKCICEQAFSAALIFLSIIVLLRFSFLLDPWDFVPTFY
ncbi:lecithin retinol acyltransferase [Biomphalaria pfeifferi]|uniref:Lecithin retinol acyltransferase n=1 Tax=Biomphalaria pfeifferi TaxID=112525 RepID=A0AAD8C0P1_BIOPF|nr:lecithin retinol acyltransferase [Biomphalaria pfeifferi]